MSSVPAGREPEHWSWADVTPLGTGTVQRIAPPTTANVMLPPGRTGLGSVPPVADTVAVNVTWVPVEMVPVPLELRVVVVGPKKTPTSPEMPPVIGPDTPADWLTAPVLGVKVAIACSPLKSSTKSPFDALPNSGIVTVTVPLLPTTRPGWKYSVPRSELIVIEPFVPAGAVTVACNCPPDISTTLTEDALGVAMVRARGDAAEPPRLEPLGVKTASTSKAPAGRPTSHAALPLVTGTAEQRVCPPARLKVTVPATVPLLDTTAVKSMVWFWHRHDPEGTVSVRVVVVGVLAVPVPLAVIRTPDPLSEEPAGGV